MHRDEIISNCYSENLELRSDITFDEIINFIYHNYLERFKPRFDHYLNYYSNIPFDVAVEEACLGTFINNEGGKSTWFHQETFIKYHGHKPLKLLANKLKCLQHRLLKISDFHELYCLVKEASTTVEYIGPLSIYDTSLRLGTNLLKFPEKIYLHAGSKIGFEYLIGNSKESWYVDKKVFRSIVYLNKLDAKYIEDILCIYKNVFYQMKLP